jgi:ABC-type histidine transport system ATPase subunit
MNFIRKVSTRVLFLDGGHIIEDGTPKEVFDNPQHDRTKEFFRKMQILQEPEYTI